jgi:hypothetical protein
MAQRNALTQITILLRKTFLILLLAFWLWMLLDLVIHPISQGPNEGGNIFRWLSAGTGIFTVLTALFIMRRVPGNQLGLLLLLWGIGATGWSLRSEWANVQIGTLVTAIFGLTFFSISSPAALLVLMLFPDGKPHPARLVSKIPLLTLILVISGLFYMFGYDAKGSPGNIPNLLYIPVLRVTGQITYLVSFTLAMTLALVSLVMRYRSSSERARMQIRWLAWLLGIGILMSIFPSNKLPIWLKIFNFIYWQSFMALGIGIAVLRHNLWDIDIIIRRTLQYSLVTGVLALVFFGSVTLLQAIFSAISGEQSSLVIALSTLAIAALFNPLRKRAQSFIDRRFYRKKYDAEQILESFSANARNEVELSRLSAELVRAASDTLKPDKVSLWIKKT